MEEKITIVDDKFIERHNKLLREFGGAPDEELIDDEPRDTYSDCGHGDLDDEQGMD